MVEVCGVFVMIFPKNAVIFGVYNSSSSHADNCEDNI